jgi:microcystin-dependent protein
MFGGNFPPVGWAFCNGQTIPISENEVLFTLIGTTYGGDGTTTFRLPDLQGRLPVHQGGAASIGESAGEENHTLTVSEIPSHSHTVNAMGAGTTNTVAGNMYGGGGLQAYKPTTGGVMNAAVVKSNSGSLPHSNLMPFQAVSFIIALFGIFPSRS